MDRVVAFADDAFKMDESFRSVVCRYYDECVHFCDTAGGVDWPGDDWVNGSRDGSTNCPSYKLFPGK